MATRLLWFRSDLRLEDNAALAAAVGSGDGVVPVYVMPTPLHTAGMRWLECSLASLNGSLRSRGSALTVIDGPPEDALERLVRERGAHAVHCTRVWSPKGVSQESRVESRLHAAGVRLEVSEGSLLVTPEELKTGGGTPYRVFTPYYRAWLRAWRNRDPIPAPAHIPTPTDSPAAATGWAGASTEPPPWGTPGETGARARLLEFAEGPASDYAERHDLPALRGTSELSPHLAFGEISPGQVVSGLAGLPAEVVAPFVRQLAWREFAYHVLHHFPHSTSMPLQSRFTGFPWSEDAAALDAWKHGMTGYPFVDAGIRQLLATGWMHNRVRLVVGSVLTKNLLIPWQTGESFFEEHLADFDRASNVFNWQWVAGCGADAAPYFRIFSPARQGARFDPGGEYVRKWVPELEHLPNRWIHDPAAAPESVLVAAGVRLGRDYPLPVIDHAEARARALAAYDAIRLS